MKNSTMMDDDAAMSMAQNNSLMSMLGVLFNETISKSDNPEAFMAQLYETCEEHILDEMIKLESVQPAIASAGIKAKAS